MLELELAHQLLELGVARVLAQAVATRLVQVVGTPLRVGPRLPASGQLARGEGGLLGHPHELGVRSRLQPQPGCVLLLGRAPVPKPQRWRRLAATAAAAAATAATATAAADADAANADATTAAAAVQYAGRTTTADGVDHLAVAPRRWGGGGPWWRRRGRGGVAIHPRLARPPPLLPGLGLATRLPMVEARLES